MRATNFRHTNTAYRSWMRRGLLIASVLILAFAMFGQAAQAITESELESVLGGYQHYDPTESASCTGAPVAAAPTGRFLPAGPGATLDGHTLPAVVGGTGLEEEAVRTGNSAQLAPGTSNPGANLALAPDGLTDRDVQFYFNMRWRYSEWNWRGDGQSGPEDVGWYTEEVRKVLVTNTKDANNPDDDVSIVVSVVESGPAPWTGVQEPENISEPGYWQGYIDGTPPAYSGRVSGLAPDAFAALGSTEELMRTPSGGVDLYYQWAPDQDVEAGTTYTGQVSGAVPPSQLAGGPSIECEGAAGASESFVFYSQYNQEWTDHCYGNSSNRCATTLGPSGCGPASLAMVVATMADQSITPIQTADWGTDNNMYIDGVGSSWQLFTQGANNWGLSSVAIGTNLDQAISALRNGALVIASGTGASPYTTSGHILVLRGVTSSGKILLGDPNTSVPPDQAANNTKEWEPSEIKQGLRQLWIITNDEN